MVPGPRRFELLRKLGEGTFGELYEARDREHGIHVALKTLKSSDPDWIYRFKREFRTVGELAHRNLVHLRELFCEDGGWHLTMDLIDGLAFDDYLSREPARLRPSFAQLALGLHELHRSCCLHRDLKPSNALVEATGRVVLLDFGLAIPVRASQQTRVAGTPLYMAPELGLGWAPTEAADWYAFGVMLYGALGGVKPFSGDNVDMLRQKLGERPPSPTVLRPEADPALAALAMRLLDRDPAKRPQAAEILTELAVPAEEVAAVARRHARTTVVGRQRELAALEDALAAVEDHPVVVTVREGAGMGKTTLVRRFLKQLRKRAQTYDGRCLELETVPYKGLDGAIDMLCNDLRHRTGSLDEIVPDGAPALSRLFPVLARLPAFARPSEDAPHTRRAGIEALGDLLGLMSVSSPVVMFLDDVQWVSDDTVQLLLDLFAWKPPPILLVLAFRDVDDAAAPALATLRAGLVERALPVRELALPPLDQAAVTELLSARAEIRAEDALRDTAGHPYLLARLASGGSIDDELVALAPEARRLLEVIASAGGPIRMGLEDAAITEQLRRRRLIRVHAATLDVYHPRLRAEVLDAMRRHP